MNIAYTASFGGEVFKPLRDAMALVNDPVRLANRIGPPLAYHWADHLKHYPRLDGPFQGFPSTGFGEQTAESVQDIPTGEGVLLRAHHVGIRQRYYGGTIRPVRARVLCFGIKPESYGKSYREMKRELGIDKPTAVVTEATKSGQLVTRRRKLTEDENKDRRRYLRGLFGFATSVTQRPNPNVTPPDLQEFAAQELGKATAAILQRREP